MKPRISKKDAHCFAHEDTHKTVEYRFIAKDGKQLVGYKVKTLCGHWFTACEDDPAYLPGLWSFKRTDGHPTCPECVEKAAPGYPGMLLVIRGALGIPQIVEVAPDERWVVVHGMSKGKVVSSEGKTVCHVCQEGDYFEDVAIVVVREDGKLILKRHQESDTNG